MCAQLAAANLGPRFVLLAANASFVTFSCSPTVLRSELAMETDPETKLPYPWRILTWPGGAYNVNIPRGALVAFREVGPVADAGIEKAPLSKEVEVRVHGQQRVVIIVEPTPDAACLASDLPEHLVRRRNGPACNNAQDNLQWLRVPFDALGKARFEAR
jgi:hypothetical protein